MSPLLCQLSYAGKKTTGLIPVELRGWDSNPRPSGYEPDELPLLHPALTAQEYKQS